MKRLLLSNHRITPNQKGSHIGSFSAHGFSTPTPVIALHDPSGKFILKGNKLNLKPEIQFSSLETAFFYDISISATDAQTPVEQKFRLVRNDFLRNCVVAHRGAWKSGVGSKNSLSAFREAIDKEYGMFECDVLLSSDDQVVVVHGPSTGMDGGIPDLDVANSTWAHLSQVKLKNQESLPLLHDLIQIMIKQNKTGILIELKDTGNNKNHLLAQSVYAIVSELKAQAWVRYISFEYPMLQALLELDEFAKCAPLEPIPKKTPQTYAKEGMWGINFNQDYYDSQESITQFQNAGLVVSSWTVNTPTKMKQFLAWDMDLITTDHPETLYSLCQAEFPHKL